MAERKYTHGLELVEIDGSTLLNIGDIEIWDGADLSLVRDTLARLAGQEYIKSFTIDMKFVQYIPSGFFGMLYDWCERGVEIRLLQPRARVQNMLWFQKFFVDLGNGYFQLILGSVELQTSSPLAWPEETDDESSQAVQFAVI